MVFRLEFRLPSVLTSPAHCILETNSGVSITAPGELQAMLRQAEKGGDSIDDALILTPLVCILLYLESKPKSLQIIIVEVSIVYRNIS
jgi:hypothetical protein